MTEPLPLSPSSFLSLPTSLQSSSNLGNLGKPSDPFYFPPTLSLFSLPPPSPPRKRNTNNFPLHHTLRPTLLIQPPLTSKNNSKKNRATLLPVLFSVPLLLPPPLIRNQPHISTPPLNLTLNERPSNKAIPTFETSILGLFNSSTQSAEASTTSSQQQASNGAFYRCYLPRLTGSLDHLLACENHHQTHPFLPRRKSLPAPQALNRLPFSILRPPSHPRSHLASSRSIPKASSTRYTTPPHLQHQTKYNVCPSGFHFPQR